MRQLVKISLFVIIVGLPFFFMSTGCSLYRTRKNIEHAEQNLRSEKPNSLEEVISAYKTAIELYRKKGYTDEIADIFQKLARLYIDHDPKEALQYYLKAVKTWVDQEDNQKTYSLLAALYNDLNSTLSRKQRIKLLIELTKLAKSLDMEGDQFSWLLELYSRIDRHKYQGKLIEFIENTNNPVYEEKYLLSEARSLNATGDILTAYQYYLKIIDSLERRGDDKTEIEVRLEAMKLGVILHPPSIVEHIQRLTELIIKPDTTYPIVTFTSHIRQSTNIPISRTAFQNERSTGLDIEEILEEWDLHFLSQLQDKDLCTYNCDLTWILNNTINKGIERIDSATTHCLLDKSSDDILNLVRTIVGIGLTDLALSILDDVLNERNLETMPFLSDLFLLKTEANISMYNSQKAFNCIIEGLNIIDTDQRNKQLTYLAQASDLLIDRKEYKNVLDLILKIDDNLLMDRNNPETLGRILDNISKAYFVLGEDTKALTMAQDAFAQYATDKGYQLKKAEIYQRIGDISKQQGFIDQKFNPYNLARSFLNDINIQSLAPELYLKTIKTLFEEDKPEKRHSSDQFIDWYLEVSHAFLFNHEFYSQNEAEILDLLLKNQCYDQALFFLENVERTEVLRPVIRDREVNDVRCILDFYSPGSDTFTSEEQFERIILLRRAKKYVFDMIKQDLNRPFNTQNLLPERLNEFKKLQIEYYKLLTISSYSDRRLRLSKKDMKMIVRRIPLDTLVLSIYSFQGQYYFFTINNRHIQFLGTKRITNPEQTTEENELKLDTILSKTLEKSKQSRQSFSKIIVVTSHSPFISQFKNLLASGNHQNAANKYTYIPTIDLL